MTMTMKENEHREMTLADYEARIHLYKEQIGTGYIGIGRTLIEAKEAGAVPHGAWEDWVTRVTGLTPRQAQRCMQAAREIRDGSALARLEMSKAMALLSSGLDEDRMEALAEKAGEEGVTLKALQQEIGQLKKDLAWAERKAGEETGKATEAKLQTLEVQNVADGLREDLEKSRAEAVDLRRQLQRVDEYVEEQKKQAYREAEDEIGKNAGGIIDGLRAELAAAEAREEKRARELEALRAGRRQQAMDEARGVSAQAMSGLDLAAAVRAFIGSAGTLPQMGDAIRKMKAADREAIRQNVETVARWVDGARAALGIYPADGHVA